MSPPGAPAGMSWLEMAPTTVSGRTTCLVVGLDAAPAIPSEPLLASKLTTCPIAAAALGKPSVIAVRSVKTTSGAKSEPGSRPVVTLRPGLIWFMGGSETSAPGAVPTGGAEAAEPAAGGTVKVPLMPICPHAARTCGRLLSVGSVAALNAPVPLSPTG